MRDNDIGLRSYQDIEAPPFEDAIPTDKQMQTLFRENAVDLFREVLESIDETGETIWFDYVPDEIMVYTTSKTTKRMDMIIDISLAKLAPKTFDDTMIQMFADLGNWVDRTIAKKKKEAKNG